MQFKYGRIRHLMFIVLISLTYCVYAVLMTWDPGTRQGLQAAFYDNPEREGMPVLTFVGGVFTTAMLNNLQQQFPYPYKAYSIEWNGLIRLPRMADYLFFAEADDSVEVWIDHEQVVRDDRASNGMGQQGGIFLEKGVHPITIRYIQYEGEALLRIGWQPTPAFTIPLTNDVLLPINSLFKYHLYHGCRTLLPYLALLWGGILLWIAGGYVWSPALRARCKSHILTLVPLWQNRRVLWIWLVSVALGGLVYVNYIERLTWPPASHFPDRSIGMAIVGGMEASQRLAVYFGTLFLFVAVVGLSFMLLLWLHGWISNRLKSLYITVEYAMLSLLAAFTLLLTLFAIITRQPFLHDLILVLLSCMVLTLILIMMKIAAVHTPAVFREYSNYALIMAGVVCPYLISCLYWVIMDGEFTFTGLYWAKYLLGIVLFWAVAPRIVSKHPEHRRRATRQLLIAGMPCALIPLSIPLSNELQFTLVTIWPDSPRVLALFTIGLLLIASAVLYGAAGHFAPLQRLRWKSSNIIAYWYFPACLASLELFMSYRHTFSFSNHLDLFHGGQTTLTAHQFFHFSAIPFIDFFPMPGLSNFFFQFLYSLINGYRGVEVLMWQWLYSLCCVVLVYWFLAKLITPLFALLTAVFIPLEALGFSSGSMMYPDTQFYMLLAPMLLLPWVAKHPTFGRYMLFWSIMAWVYLWRYDIGMTGLVAIVGILAGINLQHKRTSWRQWIRATLPVPILSGILVFGTGLGGYLVLSVYRGYSIGERLSHYLAYMRMQVAQALPLFQAFSPTAVWAYLMLPLIPLCYVGYYGYSLLTRKPLAQRHFWLAGIALFTLLHTPARYFIRHTLYEYSSQPLCIFLLCCAPFYFGSKLKTLSAGLIFLAVFGGLSMVYPQSKIVRIKEGRLFRFTDWRTRTQRMSIQDDQFSEFVGFLDATLHPQQTFYDLSNSTMLYLFADRKFPTYNSFLSSETLQNYALNALQRLYAQKKIPLILFKRQWWGDAIDGVPNEIRNYKIAEFIYQHYVPFGTLSNDQIWRAKDTTLDIPRAYQGIFRPDITVAQHFSLRQLPAIWGRYDPYKAASATPVLETLLQTPRMMQPATPLHLTVNPHVDKTSGNYLHFKMQSYLAGTLTLAYGMASPATITFDVIAADQEIDYLVRISSQWAWMNEPISNLTLTASVPLSLQAVHLRKGD